MPDAVAARYRGTFARWHAEARRNGAQDGAAVMWALMGAADRHTAAVHGSSGTAEGPAGDTVAFDEITTEEAAEVFSGCKVRNILDLIHRGRLSNRRQGREWRVDRGEVMERANQKGVT